MCTQTGSESAKKQKPKEEKIDPRCIVKFRPGDDWEGQYGFDWFREYGDGEGEKTIYGNWDFYPYEISPGVYTIGKYTKNGWFLDGSFLDGKFLEEEPDTKKLNEYDFYHKILFDGGIQIDYVNNILDGEISNYFSIPINGSDTPYIVPSLSMFRNNQLNNQSVKTTINLFLTQCSDVDKIVFRCDDEVHLSTDKVINVNHFRNNKVDLTISIKSKKYLDDVKTIKVYAKTQKEFEDGDMGTLAGQLSLYCFMPKFVDVVFVPVKVRLNKEISLSNIISFINGLFVDQINKEKEKLAMYLSQACVVPIYINDRKLELTEKEIEPYKVPNKLGLHRKEYDLIKLLLKKFYLIYKNDIVAKNAYKIFILNTPGLSGEGSAKEPYYPIAGHSYGIPSPSKAAIIFQDPSGSDICHELLHGFGLRHSFNNKSTHTFEAKTTSNIMDYPNSLEQVSLWSWQWKIIRDAAGMRDYKTHLYVVE